ncbi:uncharacterized protein LOC118189772, partial [Stegodyphus dumicola]|uniref:uncharacterized protein LOC118189772 n=1 Tax=Stegodyphus dumicola TaxID=202533 RepID=UPI0015AF2E99
MKHEACGYAYIIIGPDGKSLKPAHVYRGSDAVDNFLQNIIREKDELAETLTHIVPLIMTPQQEQDFLTATICNLCKKPLYKDRVRDHDHLTGHYRGALHSLCNLKYRLQKKIPVVFHNLKHYDAHHIMQGLGKKIEDHQIEVIATNMEKYITFALSKKHNKIKVSLQFIDSFQFLNTSLEKLVQNLPAEKFNILKENVREGDLSLLLKKGIYPYDYIQSFEMFEETALPPPAAFHNSLTDEEISASDYEHAQAVWNSFNIRTMGEYHDLYVKSDVLQLADVFENFRKLCLQFYEIDCAHVMTSPGLSWQACLKMIEQPLELLTDVDMHLFIEQGIRGGISVITKRWAQANNHYMPNYDSTNPESYIMYLDANNLYGWAMSQALPYGEFEWISAEAVTPEWILSISENSTEGYILEVDLEYPPELHDAHNDYPLAPEKLKINLEDLSPFSQNILPYQNFNSQIKLIPNLKHKQNYIVYYKNLQFYLKEGLKLTAVHRILKFKQKAWLKPYIDFNTEQRKNSKSAFEKDFFKLLNNSIYGKTMENIRNHVNVQLVNERKKAEKLVACPTFKRFEIFSENLVAVERLKNTLTLNRPIYSRREIQYRIASEEHHLFTLRQNKLSLSPFDDKRYILEDGIHTLAYGHYKIEADKEK